MNTVTTELIPAAEDGVRKAGYPFPEKTLANWRSARIGPKFVRCGRRVFYRRSDIEAYLAARTVETRDAA